MDKPAIRSMNPEDYENVIAFWKSFEFIGLSASDEPQPLKEFLKSNEGLCFVAEIERQLIGTVLCGSDGRRGYLYHLAVSEDHRKKGIGKILVQKVLSGLEKRNIDKCHLFVFESNKNAQIFYANTGWTRRDDIVVYSQTTVKS